ncbi:MAG: phospho-N-acetylmuramoyl-pentapeptide-transferase [Planctomycetota bacterium]|nr:phospho-N-acetylmuramoyl-pentapeptide-transferase [Planctomycetota bacterium]
MLYVLLDNLRTWLSEHSLYGLFSVLDQIQFRALASAGLSFIIMLALGRRFIAYLRRLKVGDAGLSDADALRAHTASKANTPTMGGALIIFAVGVSVLLLADIRQFYIQMAMIVMFCYAGLGSVDDYLKLTAARRGTGSRQGLYAWEKLVFQLGLAFLVGLFAYRHGDSGAAHSMAHVVNLPFQKSYESVGTPNPALWYLPLGAFVLLSMLMITGLSNAANITDGMDGLAGGISAAVSLGLFVLCLIAGKESWAQYLLVPHVPGADELAVLAGGMGGACLGFLWWNCSPAQVFMGDTGSLALGGLIAYLALIIRQEFVVLLMCGVFIIEAGSVMIQVGYFKATKGKRVFKCAPYHHHLHLSGWTEQQVVARFWIISVLLVVIALASIKVR